MSKELKTNLWWSLIITVISIVYILLYVAITSAVCPANTPALWATYVTLPIFFLLAGSEPNKTLIPKICLCAIIGYLWGLLFLKIVGAAAPSIGLYPAYLIAIIVVVGLACVIHLSFLANTIIGNTPIVFAGLAVCVATTTIAGFAKASPGVSGVVACITMVLGVLLAAIMVAAAPIAAKWAGADK